MKVTIVFDSVSALKELLEEYRELVEREERQCTENSKKLGKKHEKDGGCFTDFYRQIDSLFFYLREAEKKANDVNVEVGA